MLHKAVSLILIALVTAEASDARWDQVVPRVMESYQPKRQNLRTRQTQRPWEQLTPRYEDFPRGSKRTEKDSEHNLVAIS